VDLGHGLACRGHEQEVEDVRSMIARARTTQSAGARYKYVSTAFFLVLGLTFLIQGLLVPGRGAVFAIAMGAAFLAYAIALLFAVRRTFGKPASP
jgi:hypothetical protein